MDKDTLYYDGACPICSAEVARLAHFAKDNLELRNIHELGEADARLDKHELLSKLHLKTADGKWITGLHANIRAWHHTPFRYLWRLLDLPLIRLVSHRCYDFWLRQRNRSR